MRRTAVPAVLLLAAGCGGDPAADLPAPAGDRAQIVVAVSAIPRPGVRPARGGEGYGAGPEAGRAYERVDYRRMPDIAVVLSGAGLGGGGPVPRKERLTARADGFDRELVLLGPGGCTELEIENRLDRELNVFCLGRERGNDGFDVAIPARQKRSVTLCAPGVYEIACAEEPAFAAEAVVAGSGQAMLVRSGQTAVFADLPPGSYEVAVRAPRLPPWRSRVEAPAGRRTAVSAILTVGNLESVRQ